MMIIEFIHRDLKRVTVVSLCYVAIAEAKSCFGCTRSNDPVHKLCQLGTDPQHLSRKKVQIRRSVLGDNSYQTH